MGERGEGTPFCGPLAEASPDFRARVVIRNQLYLDWEDEALGWMTQIGTGDTDASGGGRGALQRGCCGLEPGMGTSTVGCEMGVGESCVVCVEESASVREDGIRSKLE